MKIINGKWATALLCSTIFFGLNISAEASGTHEGILVENCRIRYIPAKEPKAAGYMAIHNHGPEDRVLVSLSTDKAEKVEMHETLIEGNMAKMRRVEELTIPSNGSVEMKSGGYHLMFQKISPDLKFGDSVTLTLHFKNGKKVEAAAKVISIMEDMEMRHKNMGH